MSAEHAEQLAAGVTHGNGDVDEAIGFVVGTLHEQRGEQESLVHVADGDSLEALLEPGACSHGLPLQHAAGCRHDIAVYVGETNPGEIKGMLKGLERAAQRGRIALP